VLLNKDDLVVDANRADQRNDGRGGEVIILSCSSTLGIVEGVYRSTGPLVVADVVSCTASVVAVTRARHAAEAVVLPDITLGLNGLEIATDALSTILDTSSRVTELLAAGEAGLDGHVASGVAGRVFIEPLEDIGVVVVKDTPLVLPVTRQIILLRNRNGPDGKVSIGVEGQTVTSAAELIFVALARHIAIRLFGLGGGIIEGVAAVALLCILQTRHFEAVLDTGSNAFLGSHG
jgi:hypothetical protein